MDSQVSAVADLLETTPHKRLPLVLVGLASILGAIAATYLMIAGVNEDRAGSHVSRLIAVQHAGDASTQSVGLFTTWIHQERVRLSVDADERANSGLDSDYLIAIAEADVVKRRLTPIVDELNGLARSEQLPRYARDIFASSVVSRSRLSRQIREGRQIAEAYSDKRRLASEALFLIAVGMALLALSVSPSSRIASRVMVATGAVGLVVALVLVSTAMLA